jgi:hypothetical protein
LLAWAIGLVETIQVQVTFPNEATPVTAKVLAKATAPETLAVPFTVRVAFGEAVMIPT